MTDWLDSGSGFRGRAQRCWSWRLQSLAVAKRSCDHDTTENEIIARGLAWTGVCVMPHIPRRAWQTISVNLHDYGLGESTEASLVLADKVIVTPRKDDLAVSDQDILLDRHESN